MNLGVCHVNAVVQELNVECKIKESVSAGEPCWAIVHEELRKRRRARSWRVWCGDSSRHPISAAFS